MINLSALLNNPLADKLSSVADFTNFVSTAAKELKTIVFPNIKDDDFGNTQAVGIQGFTFDYKGEYQTQADSDITDHYVEKNYAIHDHIALKPIVISVSGEAGELVYKAPKDFAAVSQAVEKLGVLSPFAPQITQAAQNIYNEVERQYKIAQKANSAAKNIWSDYEKTAQGAGEDRQQAAFSFFHEAWEQRQIFTVMTPWQEFKNMVIMSLSATQSEETKYVTGLNIKFKQIKFAEEFKIKPLKKEMKAKIQAAEVASILL
jgi:hypothetical protein